jgi:hypothetical protein
VALRDREGNIQRLLSSRHDVLITIGMATRGLPRHMNLTARPARNRLRDAPGDDCRAEVPLSWGLR